MAVQGHCRFEIKTNKSVSVSAQGGIGIWEMRIVLWRAAAFCMTVPEFQKLEGLAGFYDHLGANIQPGVCGPGGRVVMTEMERKPGADSSQAHRENEGGS